MKKYIIIIVALLLSNMLYSQQNEFVRLDGKKFMLGCDEFYPKVMNFHYALETIDGIEALTPFFLFQNEDSCGIYDYKNFTVKECRQRLKAHMQLVKDLGFNCIRLCGVGIWVQASDNPFGNSEEVVLYFPYPTDPLVTEDLVPANYNHAFTVIDSVLAIAAEVDLKVIYLVGGGRVDKEIGFINQYADYLAAAAKHFANNPTLFAYDLYNEPGNSGYNHYDHNKMYDFEATLKWYRAIRDNAPNQLVTMGVGGLFNDIFDWDPGMLPVDFFSFHYYSYRDTLFKSTAPYFKWTGVNIEKPWIIGETGFPADDTLHFNAQGDTLSKFLYRHIAQYADTVKRLNATNGSSGFSWWLYHDACWWDNSPLILERFFGLMDQSGYTKTSDPTLPLVNGKRKIDSVTFVDYNPGYTTPTAPMPGNYYNIYGYNYSTCTGKVTRGNQPVKDAVLQGWLVFHPNQGKDLNWTKTEPTKTIYQGYNTFSNANGDFNLKTDCQTQTLSALFVSYPGDSLYGGWFDVGSTDTVDLNPLELDFGPGITNFNDFVIRSGDTLVWNNNMSMPGNLIIEDSAQLTVTSTVFFNSTGKVVVKPRGCLVVDGGRLTSGCDDTLWVGVEIQGHPLNPLTRQYQGYVELKDSAIIENAEIGLHCVLNAYDPQEETESSYSSGGIISADSSFFKNNLISVKVEPWVTNETYNSTIKNCVFTSDRNTTSVSYVAPIHIKLSNVEDVAIYGNTFKGNEDGDRPLSGTGIEALDATFDLRPEGENPYMNKFEELTYGIKCCNTSSVYNPEISLTNFNNCLRAIYLSGVTDAKVLGDTISYKSQSTTSEAYGIYLDNCDGYQVEGNIMSWSNSGDKPEFGIIINNSGENDNKIYRNTFEEIETPLNAQNVNREYYGSTGLQLLCNNIINCTVNDITVTYEEADTCNGIRKDQGKYTDPPIPAGNLFTYGDGSYINYTNSTSHNVYYAHYTQTNAIYYCGIPHYVTPKLNIWLATVQNMPTGITWDSTRWVGTDCIDFTGLSGDGKSKEGVDELKKLINLIQPKIDSAIAALKLKMDNGNTAALINRINNCPVNGYGELYSDLRKYSPYISEKVLLALINKQGFQTNLLFNLMILNPQAAKTYWLMDALKQIQPPLTTNQMNMVKELVTIFSEMEKERMQLWTLVLQRDQAYNKIELHYAHDTLDISNDSLIAILEKDPRITAKYNLVNQYIAIKDTNKANMLVNNILNLYSFDNNSIIDFENFKALFLLKKELLKNGKNFNNMDEQQMQSLIKLVEHPSLSFSEMYSLNALRQADKKTTGYIGKSSYKSQMPVYEEPILKPVENKEKDLENTELPGNTELIKQTMITEVLREDYSMNLFPNPAYEKVSIYFNVPINEENTEIEITNSTGALIKNIKVNATENLINVNTYDLRKGIYFVSLVCNKRKTNVKKLIIQ